MCPRVELAHPPSCGLLVRIPNPANEHLSPAFFCRLYFLYLNLAELES